jgi:chorismate dehydratase
LIDKIRVGAVSYLNTKPLIYGFENGLMKDSVELQMDYPANIAQKLIKNEIDVGLVPVAILLKLKQHYLITDCCIGSDGEVGSVCLFSDVPLENIERIYLDYQSNTSVQLLKILLTNFWKINPELIDAGEDFEKDINGTTAGLVIGDRAFFQKQKSKYFYDLGLAWKQMTGLPFVFAAWVSNKKLPPQLIDEFNNATRLGLQHLPEIAASNPHSQMDMLAYYTKFINYNLEDEKREGLAAFLKLIS